jgi:hypothetical protein
VRPALTRASYQGTWDFRNTTESVPAGVTRVGSRLVIGQDGSISSFSNINTSVFTPATEDFNPVTGVLDRTFSGGAVSNTVLDFLTGSASGNLNNPAPTPPSGAFIGQRR